jgi:hypothetical protein
MPKRPAQYNKIYKRLSFAKSCGFGLYSEVFAMAGAVPTQFPVTAGELLITLNPVSWQSVFKTSRISQADCNKRLNGGRPEVFSIFSPFTAKVRKGYSYKEGRSSKSYVLNRLLS